MTETATAVKHRSVSQLKEYDPERGGCPHRYYLHRVLRMWEKPAAWSPQGSAVHEAAEAYEKSLRTMSLDDAQDVFRESYAKHINDLTEDTPNFRFWFRSGGYRRTVEADIERRYGIGLEQVEKYIDYYLARPDEKPFVLPDDTLAVELPFEINLGGVIVRGYIDQVVWDPIKKRWVVRDVKTGKKPGDDFQLAVYRVAMADQYDLILEIGDYWMAVSGKPTFSYDLSEWPRERIVEEFVRVDEDIKAEQFDPNPTLDGCKMCSFNYEGGCEYAATDSF